MPRNQVGLQFRSCERFVRHFLNRRSVIALLALAPFIGLTIYANGNVFAVLTWASCMILVLASLFRPDQVTELTLSAALMAVMAVIGNFGNILLIEYERSTIDASLLWLEGGFSLSFFHWTLNHPAVFYLLIIVYYGNPVASAISVASTAQPLRAAFAFIVATVIGMLFYGIFPAVGPAHLNTIATSPRNCLPSLHMTWAMLAFFYAHRSIRIPAFVFMCLTAAATLGLGEHYILDLVAAVPLCLLVTYLWDRPDFRARWMLVEKRRASLTATGV